jgi:hypothetical protein
MMEIPSVQHYFHCRKSSPHVPRGSSDYWRSHRHRFRASALRLLRVTGGQGC